MMVKIRLKISLNFNELFKTLFSSFVLLYWATNFFVEALIPKYEIRVIIVSMEKKNDQVPNSFTPKVRARYTFSKKYNKNAVPLAVKLQEVSFKSLFFFGALINLIEMCLRYYLNT